MNGRNIPCAPQWSAVRLREQWRWDNREGPMAHWAQWTGRELESGGAGRTTTKPSGVIVSHRPLDMLALQRAVVSRSGHAGTRDNLTLGNVPLPFVGERVESS